MNRPDKAWIFDWNDSGSSDPETRPVSLMDESLRDGLQSPSVVDPPVAKKIEMLHMMERLGIQGVDLGLPGAGARMASHVSALAREISHQRMAIKPMCAARTRVEDIAPIASISQAAGIPVTVYGFVGSSPIRWLTEGWSLQLVSRWINEALDFCLREGLEFVLVTEDTTRSTPETLRRLFSDAIAQGAAGLCLCDTVGHADPAGTESLVRWTRNLVGELGCPQMRIDWHGHNDRGLGVVNSLAALAAGADCAHGTVMGVGERVGNAAIDQLLVNLRLAGKWAPSLGALSDYCNLASEALSVAIPANYPILGRDAFRTATGVHAAAVRKAQEMGDHDLADVVYSSIPASWVGRQQTIEVGPMSGAANVLHWLQKTGYGADPEMVILLLDAAKGANRVLQDRELHRLIASRAFSSVSGVAKPADNSEFIDFARAGSSRRPLIDQN